MPTVTYRCDYAKFLFTVSPEVWNLTSTRIHALSHEQKYHGEWLRSHHSTRLWFNAQTGMETWSFEMWGEWAQLVELFPHAWLQYLKRFDVRAILWEVDDASISAVGVHLHQQLDNMTVHLFSSPKRQKRAGRDRGGKGWAIGSKKSDLRISCYKIPGEPPAQEFQCTGALLRRHAENVHEIYQNRQEVYSAWAGLAARIEASGSRRLRQAFDRAGLGTAWPAYSMHNADTVESLWPEPAEPTAEELAEMASYAQQPMIDPETGEIVG